MMESTRKALEESLHLSSRDRFPIVWSEQRRELLRKTAEGDAAGSLPIDKALALPLLRCADGEFAKAQGEIIEILRTEIGRCNQDNEIFISLLNALFVAQRFDLVAAMLRDRYGFSRPFRLIAQTNADGVGQVGWQISPISEGGEHCFIFDAGVYKVDNTRNEILTFQWEFPLFAHYSTMFEQESGKVVINRADIGVVPGLAYCDSRPDYFLIPDYIFVPTHGYRYAREVFRRNHIAWADRKPVAFWRGATTGIPERPNDWSSLPRTKLCQLARRYEHTGLFDVGFSSVVQFQNSEMVEAEIKDAGLMAGLVSWEKWGRYKYQIDIDGNSSPWSNFFQKLLTGSPVLKVESPRGLIQWFYDSLRPWGNYVPIAPDMSDLMDKVRWLRRNDRAAESIGQKGLELAQQLSYERELDRSTAVISAAFRYFNGRPDGIGPYGRGGHSAPLSFTQTYWTNAKRFGGDY